jgi:hypothetical protein
MIKVNARIEGIKYTPLLCRKLETFDIDDLGAALKKDATFILKIDPINSIALSWWVSAKRTRSYPYPRVYDSFKFSGKKVTIIPILKDEGSEGDRDYLQWDTIALMSLLGVYVIIGYYKKAEKSKRYKNKITNQSYDLNYIKSKIIELMSYQSDALHWNVTQLKDSATILKKAINSYRKISNNLKVKLHSFKSAEERVIKLQNDSAKSLSRELAKSAQEREVITIQPKEKVRGKKAALNITNYLGGEYHFTADEIHINKKSLEIVEAKNTKKIGLPGLLDIKDGLTKMILFTNLRKAKIGNKTYDVIPVLKITSKSKKKLNKSEENIIKILKEEAKSNKFKIDF